MSRVRGYTCGVYHSGKVYVFGGASNPKDITFSLPISSGEVYDLAADSWKATAPMIQGRTGQACEVIGDMAYVAGGRHQDNTPSLQIYDIKKDKWSVGQPMSTLRSWPASAVLRGKLYVISGIGYGYPSSVEAYDPIKNSWSPAGNLKTGRYDLAGATINGAIWAQSGTEYTSAGSFNYDYVESYSWPWGWAGNSR